MAVLAVISVRRYQRRFQYNAVLTAPLEISPSGSVCQEICLYTSCFSYTSLASTCKQLVVCDIPWQTPILKVAAAMCLSATTSSRVIVFPALPNVQTMCKCKTIVVINFCVGQSHSVAHQHIAARATMYAHDNHSVCMMTNHTCITRRMQQMQHHIQWISFTGQEANSQLCPRMP